MVLNCPWLPLIEWVLQKYLLIQPHLSWTFTAFQDSDSFTDCRWTDSYLLSIAYCCSYFYKHCQKPLILSQFECIFRVVLVLKTYLSAESGVNEEKGIEVGSSLQKDPWKNPLCCIAFCIPLENNRSKTKHKSGWEPERQVSAWVNF